VYAGSDYSITIKDKNGSLVYTSDSSTEITAELANTTDPAKGDAMSGVKSTLADSVATTQHEVNERTRSVFDWFSATQKADVLARTALIDVSAALQTAITSGADLAFPGGSYAANNLTMSTLGQRLIANGYVKIIKNANGSILTVSGQECELSGILFSGESSTPALTGDNLVVTGANVRLNNCGSKYAYGRALLATGTGLHINGTNGIWQTTDATATGYDIEIGVSGTATLYHHLTDIYTSKATGGIKLIDTGSHSIVGGQFGKLTIAKGTGPAGVNGGMTSSCRILGDITVESSSAIFTGNQFGTIAISFAAGTSLCVIDMSNTFSAGTTITNSGNANNFIQRNLSTGSYAQFTYGVGAWYYQVDLTTGTHWFPSHVRMANNKTLSMRNAANDADLTMMTVNASDNITLGHAVGAAFTNFMAGTGGIYLAVGGAAKWNATNTGQWLPSVDNTQRIGAAGQRLLEIYCSNATINTSDARDKTDIRDSDLGLSFIERLRPVAFRWINGHNEVKVLEPEDTENSIPAVLEITPIPGIRSHYGFLAQEVKQALDAEGVADFAGWTLDDPDDPNSRQGLRYDHLEAPMVRAIQELSERLKRLESL